MLKSAVEIARAKLNVVLARAKHVVSLQRALAETFFDRAKLSVFFNRAKINAIEFGIFLTTLVHIDSAFASETVDKDVTKTFGDSYFATDIASLNTLRGVADDGNVSDYAVKLIQPGFSDTSSASDSGLCKMTDYAQTPFDYFADDYVGISFTFLKGNYYDS